MIPTVRLIRAVCLYIFRRFDHARR